MNYTTKHAIGDLVIDNLPGAVPMTVNWILIDENCVCYRCEWWVDGVLNQGVFYESGLESARYVAPDKEQSK